jgi:hypothetical protein
MNVHQGFIASLFLAAGALAADDAPKPEANAVSGKVMLNGKPLAAGMIFFHTKSGAVAATIHDGQYALKRVPAGEAKVTIDLAPIAAMAQQTKDQLARLEQRAKLMKEAKQEDKELAKQIEEMKDRLKVLQAAERQVKQISLPTKYTKRDTTPLTANITGESQTIDLELKE